MKNLLSVKGIRNWYELSETKANNLKKIDSSISVGRYRHKSQEDLALTESPVHAALLDIAHAFQDRELQPIIDILNTEHLEGTSVSDIRQKELHSNQDHKILSALKYNLPAIIQDEGHTLWHMQMAKLYINRLQVKNPGMYGDIKNALPKAMMDLYGKWTVFENNAPIKVAFSRDLIKQADVGQTEWEDSELYFFNMLHRKYKGKINLIPRVDVAKKYKIQTNQPFIPEHEQDISDDKTFVDDKGVKWEPLDKSNDPYIETTYGMNKHKKQWNFIYNQILKSGEFNQGNIHVARVNDPNDPNNIIMVLVAGDRDNPEDNEIIADITTVDESGNVANAFFTQETSIKLMQSRQAWEWANSQDDVLESGEGWDSIDPVSWILRNIFGTGDTKPKFGQIGGTEAQGDFGREEFMQLDGRLGKKAWLEEGKKRGMGEGEGPKYQGYGGLRIHAFGGKWFTEVTPPGQVEMDLFVTPVAEEIRNYEKSLADNGNPRKVNNEELANIVRIVKSRLNGKAGFFGYGVIGKENKHKTLYDAYFNPEPPPKYNSSELERIIKNYKKQKETNGETTFGSPEWDFFFSLQGIQSSSALTLDFEDSK